MLVNCKNAIVCLSYEIPERLTNTTEVTYFAYKIEPCLKSASFFADRMLKPPTAECLLQFEMG